MNQAALELLIQLKDEASKGLQGIGGALQSMGGLAVAGVAVAGAALVGFGVQAVQVAADFESGVNRFASVTGGALQAAGLNIEDFKGQWLDLGAKTQFSAAQAQDAAIALAKGGVAIKDIMGGATAAVLDLAAAGELELAPAAEIVAKQLAVWGDTGVQAAEVANLMAQAANASTVDVDELALGLANVGGVAKGAGVGFKDLVTTMALIAPGFSSASDAGTSLKSMITRLVPSTGDAKTAFAELGLSTFDTGRALEFLASKGIAPASNSLQDINGALMGYAKSMKMSKTDTHDFLLDFENNNFFDAQGQFLGMENAAKQLNTAMSGLSDIEKTEMLKTIFGDDGARAAIALIEAGSAGIVKMGADMTAAGTAAEQAKVKQQGFNFAMDALKGSMETISIVVGSLLLPVLTDVINNALIPGANAVLAFFTELSKGGAATGGLMAQLELLIPGITGFVTQVQTVFATLSTAIAASFPAIIAAVTGGVTAITTTALPVLTIALNGLVTIMDAITTAFIANWPMIQAAITAAITAITTNVLPILNASLTAMIGFMAPVVAWVVANWPLIQATITRVIQAVSNIIQVALPAIKGIFDTVFPAIVGVVTLAINTVLDVIKIAMQLITGDTTGALETLKGVFERIWNAIRGVVEAIWPAIKAAVASGVGAVKDLIVSRMNDVLSFMGSMPEKFAAIGGELMRGLWRGIQGLGGWFKSQFSAFISAMIPDFAKKALGIASPSKVMADQIGAPTVAGIMAGIASQAPRLKATMSDLLGQMTTGSALSEVGRFGTNSMMPNMAGAGSGPVTINIYAEVADDVDIDKLAYAVAARVQTRMSR